MNTVDVTHAGSRLSFLPLLGIFFPFSSCRHDEPATVAGARLQDGGRAARANDGALVEAPLWGLCLQNGELSLLGFSLSHSALTSKHGSDVPSCTSQRGAGSF